MISISFLFVSVSVGVGVFFFFVIFHAEFRKNFVFFFLYVSTITTSLYVLFTILFDFLFVVVEIKSMNKRLLMTKSRG